MSSPIGSPAASPSKAVVPAQQAATGQTIVNLDYAKQKVAALPIEEHYGAQKDVADRLLRVAKSWTINIEPGLRMDGTKWFSNLRLVSPLFICLRDSDFRVQSDLGGFRPPGQEFEWEAPVSRERSLAYHWDLAVSCVTAELI
ncbi:hypothetical protein N7492_000676 [Penicillium capsulatum]|uniref:Uncharacterized protein n=1 Tax=Penicillium capsulatum TaxID=69766 RepID=A0A9W9ITZ6_9EURO|nr:hypothetical protein N7492_000676 [Penicillium capsulatum]KAJ6130265.1 hypothetical protein N7512_003045 [Penicillium capsulatum]